MTKKELIIALIAHYEKCIKEFPGKWYSKNNIQYLYKVQVHSGICNCALEIFKELIYKSDWIEKYHRNGDFWVTPPKLNIYRYAAIINLKKRVKILKKELKQTT